MSLEGTKGWSVVNANWQERPTVGATGKGNSPPQHPGSPAYVWMDIFRHRGGFLSVSLLQNSYWQYKCIFLGLQAFIRLRLIISFRLMRNIYIFFLKNSNCLIHASLACCLGYFMRNCESSQWVIRWLVNVPDITHILKFNCFLLSSQWSVFMYLFHFHHCLITLKVPHIKNWIVFAS